VDALPPDYADVLPLMAQARDRAVRILQEQENRRQQNAASRRH